MKTALVLALLLSSLPARAGDSLRIGDPAPPLKLRKLLQAPEGASVSWDALRGKVVVLEFWGSWCQPCLPAMDHLNEVAGKLQGKPFQVVAITDERDEPVDRYVRKNPSRLWIGLDEANATFDAYGADGVPYTVVVDRQGRIVAVTHPAYVNVEAVESLLAGRAIDLPVREKAAAAPPIPPGGNEPEALFRAVFRPVPSGTSTLATDSTGRWIIATGPVSNLLQAAYGLPDWSFELDLEIPKDHYAAEVRVPEGSERLLMPTLQQMVLASLKLGVTEETRNREVFLLRRAPGQAGPRASEASLSFSSKGTTIEAVASPIEKLTQALGKKLRSPVLDETGLTGRYDFYLDWDPQEPGALERELAKLGLVLVRETRPVEVKVVRPAKS